MSEKRPCPRHPENGDVTWFEVIETPRFVGGIPRTGELNTCIPCISGSKPYERPEFAS